ncbi:hypothetical protein [Stenomitos frigidus]|uniref:Uncharacterized protein n=1 Tax=Stenomitos frigidus ULC18 TaxID=2107698 RepID=A0A2T1DWR7_9CYAN|nr:hypothetical protein [Stenomitos frigidus]PSB24824.1 hypothetical protein C7B82_25845 [Stenomitos frigidus ULC18]
MTSNYISGALLPQDREQILADLAEIRTKLPFIIEMAGKAKRALPKMGDKSRAFVHKAMEVATQHPDYLPRSFDLEEMQRDVALFEAIYPIAMALNQLQAELDDTLVAVGSDAYSAALQVYRHVKAHGEGSGLDALVDDMGQRFGRKLKKTGMTE